MIPRHDAVKTVNKVLQPAIRFERDKCIDIPPCQIEDVIVEFTPEQRAVYESMRKSLKVEYEGGFIIASNAAVKMMKLFRYPHLLELNK